jgi:hypothetical protein
MRSKRAVGARARVARERSLCTMSGPPLGIPFGEQSRRNHDAIMMRSMSHHWHSASDALDAAVNARGARSSAGRLSAAPSVSNQDVIMMQS